MARTHGPIVRLPRSGVQVCLKHGRYMSDEEVSDLDAYFLEITALQARGGSIQVEDDGMPAEGELEEDWARDRDR